MYTVDADYCALLRHWWRSKPMDDIDYQNNLFWLDDETTMFLSEDRGDGVVFIVLANPEWQGTCNPQHKLIPASAIYDDMELTGNQWIAKTFLEAVLTPNELGLLQLAYELQQ